MENITFTPTRRWTTIKEKQTKVIGLKGLLWVVGMFLLLVVIFITIWVMTADRVGNSEVLLPEGGIEYVGTAKEAVYNQWFI